MLGLINKRQINKFKTVAKGGVFLAAVLCFSVCLFSPLFVQGQTDPPTETIVQPDLDLGMGYIEQTGLQNGNLISIIANVIRVALGLLGLLAVIIVLYGGWLWMTAGGNEEQVGSAKKTLINGTIGLAIILSAYAIVSFVMSFFGLGGGGNPSDGDYTLNPPGIMNVVGGGALGDVVKDHYPTRGQEDVPRNTRIAITFAKPLQWESVAIEVTAGEITKYRLNTSTISVGKIVASSTAQYGFIIEPYPGNLEVQAFPIFNDKSGRNEIYTIVITPDPSILLGDSEEKISYSVRVNNNLKDETGKPIFQNARCRCNEYIWSFTCSTIVDNTPPRVISVFPEDGDGTVPRNAKLQIKFNEAIFPNAQVSFRTSSNLTNGMYYEDKTNNSPIVFIKSVSSSLPVGSFRIVNQYRTLEFISSLQCGVNACGLPIFCLPVCDLPGANCHVGVDGAEAQYNVLFKAASTSTDPTKPPFYSEAMDGIVDMAGNALDDGDDIVENKFIDGNPFSTDSIKPDNKHWSFTAVAKLDLTTPFITNLSLGPETTFVLAKDNMDIVWSKKMSEYSLGNINITESPEASQRCTVLAGDPWFIPANRCSLEPIGYVPSTDEFNNSVVSATTSKTSMRHTPFLDGLDIYYLPEITSGVEDLYGNCFFPGQGPKEGTGDKRDVSCSSKTGGADCCMGPYCCNGNSVNAGGAGYSSSTCINEYKFTIPITQ